MNKSAVLRKAVDHIRSLEKQISKLRDENDRLGKENNDLRTRLGEPVESLHLAHSPLSDSNSGTGSDELDEDAMLPQEFSPRSDNSSSSGCGSGSEPGSPFGGSDSPPPTDAVVTSGKVSTDCDYAVLQSGLIFTTF